MVPALVGAGEEAREESRAKKLAASSTADWIEVTCPPADARESDSGSRGLKGGTGELDPKGCVFMPSRHECSLCEFVGGPGDPQALYDVDVGDDIIVSALMLQHIKEICSNCNCKRKFCRLGANRFKSS